VSVQSRLNSASGQEPQRFLAGADLASFTELFRARAAHVFDYCNCLLGDDEEAAAATAATFITAHSLLHRLRNPARVDAWLFALARHECMSKQPARAEMGGGGPPPVPVSDSPGPGAPALPPPAGPLAGPDAASPEDRGAAGLADRGAASPEDRGAASLADADADTDELAAVIDVADDRQAREVLAAFSALPVSDREVLAAFSALRPRDREILDLVYWHGIRPAELPAILGISAQRAYTLLTAAVKRFRRSAERVHATTVRQGVQAPRSGDDLLAAMPTASLPGAVWYRTARAVFEQEFRGYYRAVAAHAGQLRADGFPGQAAAVGGRARALGVAAAVVVPVLAGTAAIAYAASSTHSPVVPGGGQSVAASPGRPSTVAGSSSARSASAHSHHGAMPVSSLFPSAPQQTAPPVYPSPSRNSAPSPAPSSSRPSSAPSSAQPTLSSPAHSSPPTLSPSPTTSTSQSSTPTSTPTTTSSLTSPPTSSTSASSQAASSSPRRPGPTPSPSPD
jgi:DNA-directed RNA polymerase specialized sigma24 family protein